MEFKLNETQESVREMARDFTARYIEPRVEEIEEAEKMPADIISQMVEAGFVGLNAPEKFGGMELGFLATSMAIEEISKVSASAGTFLTVTHLPIDALNLFGTEEQKEKYIPDLVQGKGIGSFAFTEAETGSDPKQLKTVVRSAGDGTFEINGVKRFISNAAYKGPMILFAREVEGDGCTAFIIDKFCKGYSLSTPWEKVGLQGSHIYDVFLDGVKVTEADILGERGKGFDYLIGATAYGKLGFSAVFAGVTAGARDIAVQYAKEKLHRGKPIAKFPTIQVKLAELAADALSAELMLYKSAEDADTLTDVRKVQCSTALVKGYVAELCVAATTKALNVLASYGVTKEYKIERLVRDSLVAPNVEGAADIQKLIAGSYLGRN